MAKEITSREDELVMKLLHYFITEANYTPIVLHGANNEIWLENFDNDYKIVRIVSNYIHNNDQFENDLYKTKQIMKSIGKKTLSYSLNTLSLFINLGDNVDMNNLEIDDNIKCADIKKITDLKKYDFITNYFPNIVQKTKFNEEGMELFAKITGDISTKTENNAKEAEDVFKLKKPYVTYAFLILNLILYVLAVFTNLKSGAGIYDALFDTTINSLNLYGGLNRKLVLEGEYYRLILAAFNHIGLIHLLFNSYALYVIGSQIESYMGRKNYFLIYILSAVAGNLLSMSFFDGWSAGASGAIFGLLGSLLYFGYHYRIFLGNVIKSQIIPLILLNLAIGFMAEGINNAAHIGGLIAGILLTAAAGVKYKSTKTDKINGLILSTIYFAFLVYIAFFR